MQHFLKPAPGAARTEIIAAQLLEELFVAMNESIATTDASFAQGTPFDACWSAQKEWRFSKSLFLAIQPPFRVDENSN